MKGRKGKKKAHGSKNDKEESPRATHRAQVGGSGSLLHGNGIPAVEMAAHAPAHWPCSKRNINNKVKAEKKKNDALPSSSSAGLLSGGHKPITLLLAEGLGV